MAKQNKELKFRWIDNSDERGVKNFTFDGEKIYNLWKDYPRKLTREERRIFAEENPDWVEFFEDRRFTLKNIINIISKNSKNRTKKKKK